MLLAPTIQLLADARSAADIMHSYVSPIIQVMCILASLACAFFLVNGGVQYATSSGKPERLESAKIIIRNALIGLVIVIAAGTFTAILTHAFHQSTRTTSSNLPILNDVRPDSSDGGFAGILLKAITSVLNNLIQAAAGPFLKALGHFTSSTPLISDNSNVFNLWLTVVGMADVIFVLVVALLGFHVMSYATFGLEEIEFKHMLPQLVLIFLLMNSSVFIIDGLIGFSNVMIHTLQAGLSEASVWDVLTIVAKRSGGYGLAALLIMIAFLIVSVILLIYYVGRIITIYLGAILSPLVLLTWLVPGFRDFAQTAARTYVTTIFLLFVHVVILELAASLFAGMAAGNPIHTTDPLMSMIVGLATLVALLKTQGVMMQLSYASIGPRAARKLGGQFMNGITYVNGIRAGRTVDIAHSGLGRRPVPGNSTADSFSSTRTNTVTRRQRGSNVTVTHNGTKPSDATGITATAPTITKKRRIMEKS